MQPTTPSSSSGAASPRDDGSPQPSGSPSDGSPLEDSIAGNGPLSVAPAPAPTEAAGEGFFRALIRYKNGDISLKIPDHALAKSLKKHSSPSAKELMEALKETVALVPESPFDFGTVHFKESSIPPQSILNMEARLMPKGYKFGVMYAKQGQTTDDEILSNNESSAAFEMFLKILGDRVDLRGFDGYNGGLDVRHGSTGTHSVYTKFKEHEVMFHVATLLPYVDGDQQQLEKKRHIGNDVVVIVFQDGDTPFEPDRIKSFFNHVFIVVRPIKPASATAKVSPFGMLRSRTQSSGGSALPLMRRPSANDLDANKIKSAGTTATGAPTSSETPTSPAASEPAKDPTSAPAPQQFAPPSTNPEEEATAKEDQKRLRRTKSQGIDKTVIRRAVIMAPSLVSRPLNTTPPGQSASDKDRKMERRMSKERIMSKQISREQVKKDTGPKDVSSNNSSAHSSKRNSLEDSDGGPDVAGPREVELPPKKKERISSSRSTRDLIKSGDTKDGKESGKDSTSSKDKEPRDKSKEGHRERKDKEHRDKDKKDKDKEKGDKGEKDKDKRLRATKRLSASKTKSLSQKDLRLLDKRKQAAFDLPSTSVPASMSPLMAASGSDHSDDNDSLADSEEMLGEASIPALPSHPRSHGSQRKVARRSSAKMTVTSVTPASGSDNDSPNEHARHKRKTATKRRHGDGTPPIINSSTSGSDTDPTAPMSISSPRLPTITDDSDSEAILRPPNAASLSPRDSVGGDPSPAALDTVAEATDDDSDPQPSPTAGATDAMPTSPRTTSAPEIVVTEAPTDLPLIPARAASPPPLTVTAAPPPPLEAVHVPTEQPPVAAPEAVNPVSPRDIDVSAALTLLQPIFPADQSSAEPSSPSSSSNSDSATTPKSEGGDSLASSQERPNTARRESTESKRGLLKKQSQFLVKQESNIKSFMRYRVEIVSKDGVVQSEQILPNPPIFHHGPYFKEFLLTKLINSERASYFAPQFAKPLERTRQILLENLFQEHSK